MTDPVRWPAPAARAAIGRALAGFDLDDRHGIGLRPDGLPDIDWVEFSDGLPFIFQDAEHPGLPPFAISRYPITVRQYQVFVDAPDGHVDARWWHGIEQWQYQSFWVVPNDTSSPGEWRRYEEIPRGILQPDIPDTNCPRGDVTWYQATAYCRWLSHHLGQEISLPTERQWERVARGRHGGDTPVRRATIQPAT
jgi:formylglycine-generating enzyme required for sulfatase activity